MFERGEVGSEDVEFPSASVLLEGISGEDEEDERESFERGEFLEPLTVLPLVVVKGGDLVSDLVSVLICLVDVVGEGRVLR